MNSETGRLRTVLAHRPGAELRRITPRRSGALLFDRLPWLGRAQQEHDMLTGVLRDHGVEVLYVTELLQDALEYQPARDAAIASVLSGGRLGDALGAQLRAHLEGLDPEALTRLLVAGLTPEEFPVGRGLVFDLLGDDGDFLIDPLPNLSFTRDSSVWIGDRVVVAHLPGPARSREAALTGIIYAHHPRFAGTERLLAPGDGQLTGGDVLQLSPGVIAVGTGARTTAAAAERLATLAFTAGLAHTLLVVPTARQDPSAHLDTLCTVVDAGTVVMHPAAAYSLRAHIVIQRPDGLRVSRPQPFLEAAATAMGIGELKVIKTAVDPFSTARQRWDDGANALAIDRRVVVCHERDTDANERLEAAGIEVIRVPGSELGSGRGGPRCMACPVSRDPATAPRHQGTPAGRPEPATVPVPPATDSEVEPTVGEAAAQLSPAR